MAIDPFPPNTMAVCWCGRSSLQLPSSKATQGDALRDFFVASMSCRRCFAPLGSRHDVGFTYKMTHGKKGKWSEPKLAWLCSMLILRGVPTRLEVSSARFTRFSPEIFVPKTPKKGSRIGSDRLLTIHHFSAAIMKLFWGEPLLGCPPSSQDSRDKMKV